MNRPRNPLWLGIAAAAIWATGCVETTTPPEANMPLYSGYTVRVTPKASMVPPSGRLQMKAQVFDANGDMVFNRADLPVVLRWESSNPDIAEVDETGMVIVHRKEPVSITAKLDEGSLSGMGWHGGNGQGHDNHDHDGDSDGDSDDGDSDGTAGDGDGDDDPDGASGDGDVGGDGAADAGPAGDGDGDLGGDGDGSGPDAGLAGGDGDGDLGGDGDVGGGDGDGDVPDPLPPELVIPSDGATLNGDGLEEFSDVHAIFVSPRRITIDINRPRRLSVTAIDAQGAPTTLDCGDGPTMEFDDSVTVRYNSTLGAESLDVTGRKKGFTVLTFACGDFHADPVVVEVKPSVTIPDASPSSSHSDFGWEPSLALDDERIHLTTYDAEYGKLVYTHFDGIWTSQFIDGEGDYGRQSQVVIDTSNDNRPLVCALEGDMLTCWLQDNEGYWTRHVVDQVKSEETYDSEINAAVSPDGRVFLLYHRQLDDALVFATSYDPSRDYWETEVVTNGADHSALALASDGSPRIAFRQNNAARYGHKGCFGTWPWSFEDIDAQDVVPDEDTDEEDMPTPPGTYIRLTLGEEDRPHVVYYKGGNLVHAIKTNLDWRTNVIEAVELGGASIGFALDHRGQPRVSYYDEGARLLRYASRRNLSWHIDSPTASQGIGAQSALVIDAYNRAQIAYYDGQAKDAGFYVEPHFLDYTAFLDEEPELQNSYTNECRF